MFLIDDLLSGLFGLVSTESNNQANIQAVRETNEANKKLAQYAFDRNVDMWHMQNAYNTPAEQMKRYMDAGLNANLVFSQGTSGNASTPPSYEAPHMTYYQRKALDMDFIARSLALEKERAQIRNIEADTNLKGEQTESNAASRSVALNTAEKIALDNKWRKMVFDGDLSRYNVQARKERYDEMIREMMISSRGSNEEFGVSWDWNKPVTDNDSMKERLGKLEVMELMQRLSLMHSSELDNMAKLDVMSAQVQELMSQTNLNYEQAAKLVRDFDLALLNFDKDMLKTLQSEYGNSTLGMVAREAKNILRDNTKSVNEILGGYKVPRSTEEYLERVSLGRQDITKKYGARPLKRRK